MTDERWIEIEWTVLAAGQRAGNLPADTQRVPYLARVRGMAAGDAPAAAGAPATVRTPAGRSLSGTVRDDDPSHGHGFGGPVPELTEMRERIRALLATQPTEGTQR